MAEERPSRKGPDVAPPTERPLGVAILSVLGMVGAILIVLGALLFIGIGVLSVQFPFFGLPFTFIGAFLGTVVLIIGLFFLYANWKMWNMRSVGYWINQILYVLGFLSSLAALTVDVSAGIGAAVQALIIYYLFTKKEMFD